MPRVGCTHFFLNQYYFDRGGVRIAPEAGDHVVDGGLFIGENATRMAVDAGSTGRIYAFDPVRHHCEIATHNLKRNTGETAQVRIYPYGLSDRNRDGGVSTRQNLMPAFRIEEGIATRTIDTMVDAGEIERIDFLKMDVEGSELAALRGSVKSLRRFRPKLAISLYHRAEDIFEIPLYLDETLEDYEFYLDHYTIHREETVLYGRPRP